MKKTQKNKAITLVALVITMVILIILAGVSINMLFGENGIITKAKLGKTKFLGEDAREVVEQKVAYLRQDSAQKGVDTTLYDFWFMYNGDITSDYYTDDFNIYLFTDELSAKLKPASSKTAKYSKDIEYKTALVIYKDYITFVNNNMQVSTNAIPVEEVFTEENISSFEATIENATSDNKLSSVLSQDTIQDLNVSYTLSSGSTSGNKGVIYEPETQTSEANTPTSTGGSVSTTYGRIEIVWLANNTNKVSTLPNPPVYSDLTPISFDDNGNEVNSGYYNYVAGTGTSDNTQSKWANAKTNDGSYFVWIPRFAYRILYYNSESNFNNYEQGTECGYYDGNGKWNKSTKQVQTALDSGIETVIHNGIKYIVHPAFETNLANGGWDTDITGFWFGKYEASRTDSTSSNEGTALIYKSVPNVKPATDMSIGKMFGTAKNSYTQYNGHMTKHSEWGAVGYLAYSQYGRNGYEPYSTTSDTQVITSEPNILGTTTGNYYGIHDMIRCTVEHQAGHKSGASGGNFTEMITETSSGSTKLCTVYTQNSNIGDGVKEIAGFSPLNDSAAGMSNNCTDRGAIYSYSDRGIFYSGLPYGGASKDFNGFRLALTIS